MFLVSFGAEIRHRLFELVRMEDELESILGRKVDLLTRKSVEKSPNYIRRNSILSSTQVVYEEG